jgi:ABC-type polysaccharide/polyol phosphate export permease
LKRHRRAKVVIGVVLLTLAAGAVWRWWGRGSFHLQNVVFASGTIEATEVDVSAKVSGRILKLLFGVPLRGSVVLLLVHSAVFLFASMGIGLLISVIARTQLVAFIAAMLGTMLPSVLLSGFMFPISAMPQVLQYLTYLIPARYFIVILRGIFLKGTGPEVLWKPTLSLIAFGLIAIAVSVRRFRKRL